MPKEEREAIEQEDEISGYMGQSHISDKNIKRLKELEQSSNQHIAEMAKAVLEVAAIKPYKRRRWKMIARQDRDLLIRLRNLDLIDSNGWDALYDLNWDVFKDDPEEDEAEREANGAELMALYDLMRMEDDSKLPF